MATGDVGAASSLSGTGLGLTQPSGFVLVPSRARRQRLHRPPQWEGRLLGSPSPSEEARREPAAPQLLGTPHAVRRVAPLCLGPVAHPEQVPEVEWTGRRRCRHRPLSEVVPRRPWAEPVEPAT